MIQPINQFMHKLLIRMTKEIMNAFRQLLFCHHEMIIMTGSIVEADPFVLKLEGLTSKWKITTERVFYRYLHDTFEIVLRYSSSVSSGCSRILFKHNLFRRKKYI